MKYLWIFISIPPHPILFIESTLWQIHDDGNLHAWQKYLKIQIAILLPPIPPKSNCIHSLTFIRLTWHAICSEKLMRFHVEGWGAINGRHWLWEEKFNAFSWKKGNFFLASFDFLFSHHGLKRKNFCAKVF